MIGRKRRFLLIGDVKQTPWSRNLLRALVPLGDLQLVSGVESVTAISTGAYDVIIIDAGAISSVGDLIPRLREQQPQARIVVATGSPTWRESREALQAGAMDYVRKSLDQQELCAKIQAVLELPPRY